MCQKISFQVIIYSQWNDDEHLSVYLYQQSIIHQIITDRPRDIWYTMNMCSTNDTKQNYVKSPKNATLEIFSFYYNFCVHSRASFDKDHICTKKSSPKCHYGLQRSCLFDTSCRKCVQMVIPSIIKALFKVRCL